MAPSASAKPSVYIPADWETHLINFTLSGPALAVVLKYGQDIQAFQGPFSLASFLPVIRLVEAQAKLDPLEAERFNLLRLDAEPHLIHTIRLDVSSIALTVYPGFTRLAQARTHALGLRCSLRPAPLPALLANLEGLKLRAPSAAWQFALFTEPEEPAQTWLEVF